MRGFILSPGLIKGAPYGARHGYWIREEYHYKGRTLVQMRKHSSCEQQALKLGPRRKLTSSGGRKP